ARKGHGNARLDPGFAGGAALRRPGGKLFGLDRAWDGETRPCRSGNCAPTSLTLRGAQMDLGPPGFLTGRPPQVPSGLPAANQRRPVSSLARVPSRYATLAASLAGLVFARQSSRGD